jgi:DNA polymerase I-like protein with 3'-5' exonuclease and polymerase domains
MISRLFDSHSFFNSPSQGKQLADCLWDFSLYNGAVGVDTETTGLNPFKDRVRLIQLGSPGDCIIVDLDGWRSRDPDGNLIRAVPWGKPGLRELKVLLEAGQPKVLQNAAFDLNFLRAESVLIKSPIFDTMIASKIITNGTDHKNDLGSIVARYLKVHMPKELQKADWGGGITTEMLSYAAKDARALPLLVEPLTSKLQESKILNSSSTSLFDVFTLEMQALRPIAYMQWYGFKFDKAQASRLKADLEVKADELKATFLTALDEELKQRHPEDESKWLPRDPDGSLNLRKTNVGRGANKMLAGFNPGSTQQMARAFTDAGIILPPPKPVVGKPSVPGKVSLDQTLLAFLRSEYPLIDQYMTWSTANTRVSCVETLLKAAKIHGDRIHCRYLQMGTNTGRLSASEPNLQQVPKEKTFRALFIAEPGYQLICADFSQIELRVAAELSGDERMLQAYADGRDLHTETASLIAQVALEDVTKEMRTSAKIANFGLLYGAGAKTFQRQALAQYGILYAMTECQEIVTGFRRAYPRLYEWQQEQGQGTSKAVFTRYGRRRVLIGFNDKYTTRVNTPVQGTAGDICKISMAMLWETLAITSDLDARLLSQVHDELIMEVRDELVNEWRHRLKSTMEAAGAVVCKRVPILAEVGVGSTWADAK